MWKLENWLKSNKKQENSKSCSVLFATANMRITTFWGDYISYVVFSAPTPVVCATWNWILKVIFFCCHARKHFAKIDGSVFSLLHNFLHIGFYVSIQAHHIDSTHFCRDFKLRCCNTVEDSSFHVLACSFEFWEIWKLRQSLEHRHWKFTLINIYL